MLPKSRAVRRPPLVMIATVATLNCFATASTSFACPPAEERKYMNPGEVEHDCEMAQKAYADLRACMGLGSSEARLACALDRSAPANRFVRDATGHVRPPHPILRVQRHQINCQRTPYGGTQCVLPVTIESNRGASGEIIWYWVCDELRGQLQCRKEFGRPLQ